jgi:hypothetical protein
MIVALLKRILGRSFFVTTVNRSLLSTDVLLWRGGEVAREQRRS